MLKAGQVFSGWTVVSDNALHCNGERKWLCRCECGTERYVLERSLLYGGSQSCGCRRVEMQRKKTRENMIGREFGDLKVLKQSDNQRKNGGLWLTCQCSCGKQYDCPATLLTQGRRKHCGCKTKRVRSAGISGKKLNRLTVLYPLDSRDKKGSAMWHCQCECGNEVDYSYNTLMYSNIQSCGCKKKENDQKIPTLLEYADGVSVDRIKSKKLPKANTTGYKGVYRVRGKYMAKIVLQRKQYHLGLYEKIEAAAAVRKMAEETLFGDVIRYYDLYKRRADEDPSWAEKNPIHINVKKDGVKFSVQITPEIYELALPAANELYTVNSEGSDRCAWRTLAESPQV